MEEEEELVERQQMLKKRRTEQLLTSGEVIKKILRSVLFCICYFSHLTFYTHTFSSGEL